MDTARDARSSTPSEKVLSTLLDAVSADEIIRNLTAYFGHDARLFVVDHEFGHLVPMGTAASNDEGVDLTGALRDAVLRAERFDRAGTSWVPLVERDQVVFVVSVPTDSTGDDVVLDALGEVLGGHRRRFEDIEARRRRADMAVAAELQWDLLPLRADVLGPYRVAGVLEPAYDVAGDLFDYAMCGGAIWAYSFDGMGHGMDATLASVQVLAAVRNARRQGASLDEQMQRASDELWSQYGGSRFVTGAACRLDIDGSLDVVNAGHEPIRVVQAGEVARLDLDVDLPLGVASGSGYRSQRAAELSDGDGLVIFSDGLANQRNHGEEYGDDRLDDALARKWSDIPLQTGHDVVGELLGFIEQQQTDDDVTAVVIHRTSSARSQR